MGRSNSRSARTLGMDKLKPAIGIFRLGRSHSIMTGFSQQVGRNHIHLRRSILVRAC